MVTEFTHFIWVEKLYVLANDAIKQVLSQTFRNSLTHKVEGKASESGEGATDYDND